MWRSDIADRHVLLMDPILGTGNCASYAIELLLKKGVPQDKIVFLTLISVRHAHATRARPSILYWLGFRGFSKAGLLLLIPSF